MIKLRARDSVGTLTFAIYSLCYEKRRKGRFGSAGARGTAT